MDKIGLRLNNLAINDNEIKSFSIEYNKIDGQGTKRNLEGTMRRQVIANKIKLSVGLVEHLEEDRVKKISAELTKDTSVIEFLDPITGAKTRKNVYFAPLSISMYAVAENKVIYNSFSFDAIEL